MRSQIFSISASKIAGEAFVYSYARCYGLRYLVFRFSNVYGRFDNDLDRMERVIPLFIHQLSHVLEYAEQIQQIDTTGVAPTSQVLSQMPADRADERRPGLTNAEALANAPDPSPQTGLFRVPRVL